MIRVEGDTVYVDSFAEAFQAAVDFPEVVNVVFNNPADYYTAARAAKAFGIK